MSTRLPQAVKVVVDQQELQPYMVALSDAKSIDGTYARTIDRYDWDDAAAKFAWSRELNRRILHSWEPQRAVYGDDPAPAWTHWITAYPVGDVEGVGDALFLEVVGPAEYEKVDADGEPDGLPARLVLWGPNTAPIITELEHSSDLPWRIMGAPFDGTHWWVVLATPFGAEPDELLPEYETLPALSTCVQVVRYDADFGNPTIAYQYADQSIRAHPITYHFAEGSGYVVLFYRDDTAIPTSGPGVSPNSAILFDLSTLGAGGISAGAINNSDVISDTFLAVAQPDRTQPGVAVPDNDPTVAVRRCQDSGDVSDDLVMVVAALDSSTPVVNQEVMEVAGARYPPKHKVPVSQPSLYVFEGAADGLASYYEVSENSTESAIVDTIDDLEVDEPRAAISGPVWSRWTRCAQVVARAHDPDAYPWPGEDFF